jgi:hypothetical protein
MPERYLRHVFLVVAGGNSAAERHFEDTIKRKRTLDEVRRFLPIRESENLEKIYHRSNFIVWGAVPGPMNESHWEKMTPGDVVLIYNSGRIRFAGEIAAKVTHTYSRQENPGLSYRRGKVIHLFLLPLLPYRYRINFLQKSPWTRNSQGRITLRHFEIFGMQQRWYVNDDLTQRRAARHADRWRILPTSW